MKKTGLVRLIVDRLWFFPTKVIIKSRDAIKIRAIGKKGTYQIMRKINGKVADDIVYIKDHKNKIGWVSAPASDCFLTFIESLEMVFSQYKETYEVLLDYPKIGGEDIRDYVKN